MSHEHADVTSAKRITVHLVVQLMPETTVKSLRALRGARPSDQKRLRIYEPLHFITLVDSWFDLFNSRRTNDRTNPRETYGLHLEKQNQVLEDRNM